MKRLICIGLSFIIFFSFGIQSLAVNKNIILYNENNILITLLEKTDEYQKIKIEDKNNNKIEYLESYLQEKDNYIYKATSEDDSYIIKKDQNKVLITNKSNNVIEEFDLPNANNNLNKEEYNMEYGLNSYCIPDTDWSPTTYKGYTSRSIVIGEISLIIGIIATISGVEPAAAVVISVATWYYSRVIEDAYYYYEEQTRFRDGWLEKRSYTKFYENSDYNKAINDMYSKAYRYHYVGTGCK